MFGKGWMVQPLNLCKVSAIIEVFVSFFRNLKRKFSTNTEIENQYRNLHTAYNIIYQPTTEMVSILSPSGNEIIRESVPTETWVTQNQNLIDIIIKQTETQEIDI